MRFISFPSGGTGGIKSCLGSFYDLTGRNSRNMSQDET
jgi:hypothetical protein